MNDTPETMHESPIQMTNKQPQEIIADKKSSLDYLGLTIRIFGMSFLCIIVGYSLFSPSSHCESFRLALSRLIIVVLGIVLFPRGIRYDGECSDYWEQEENFAVGEWINNMWYWFCYATLFLYYTVILILHIPINHASHTCTWKWDFDCWLLIGWFLLTTILASWTLNIAKRSRIKHKNKTTTPSS